MEQHEDLAERVERERCAHGERDVLSANLRLKQRFSHINAYPSRARLQKTLTSGGGSVYGRTVLDYGCGKGSHTLTYLRAGAGKVYGIDISPSNIETAAHAIQRAGFDPTTYDLQVMDAHRLMFDDGVFDLVIGSGILHHLDVGIALAEVHRVLKPDGRALFFEPLADNPLLRLFRRLTPGARTADERPLGRDQIAAIAEGSRWTAELRYCGLVEAPVAMLTSVFIPRHPDNSLLRLADRVERWMHKRCILTSWNQYVLFDVRKNEPFELP